VCVPPLWISCTPPLKSRILIHSWLACQRYRVCIYLVVTLYRLKIYQMFFSMFTDDKIKILSNFYMRDFLDIWKVRTLFLLWVVFSSPNSLSNASVASYMGFLDYCFGVLMCVCVLNVQYKSSWGTQSRMWLSIFKTRGMSTLVIIIASRLQNTRSL